MIYLLLFFSSIVFSLAVTPPLIRRAPAWGLIDLPDLRKRHKEPMPVTGGPVLFPLVFMGFFLVFAGTENLPFLLVALTMVFVLGVVDDIRGAHFTTKFLVQIIAALLVIQSGVLFDLNRVDLLEGLGFRFGQIGSTAVTLLWIVGITNAVNLIDGMDGLASGLCLNASVGIGAIAVMTGKPDLALMCALLAGGLLGFLRYNVDPARTYLGDSGSTLLGFTLAVISIMQSAKTSTFLVLVIPALLLAIPMTDTVQVFLKRSLRGLNPFKPDRRHLHHKLLELNFSVKQTLGIFYSLSAGLGIAALWILNSHSSKAVALAIVVLMGLVIAIKMMQVFNFHRLIRRINKRIRALARQAVSRQGSVKYRFSRNLTLLTALTFLNLLIILREVPLDYFLVTAALGLFLLGIVDFFLNRKEAQPRYEIQHAIIFLSLVLNQVLFFTLLPAGIASSPVLAAVSVLIMAVLGFVLFKTGTFATFLQDPVEILILFIAFVILELTGNLLNTAATLGLLAAVCNALVLYTASKVYLTGYRVRTRFVTAGLVVFVMAIVGAMWI